MFRNWKRIGLLVCGAGILTAQPALTTIQDILYRADGTRYSGTMFVKWNSFQAGDTSNIATSDLTLRIVNGVLNVRLVPTTTASGGAQYNLTYNSQGRNQFTEVWAVPPSALPLRVRDIRVSSGTVVGPPPVTAPIQISDVVGLSNALATLAAKGVGYLPGRAAVINQSGQIDGAAGDLGDCVRVDGSSGPCGGGSGGILPSFSDGETPAGSINGTNSTFALNFAPSPTGSLELYRNGLLMRPGTDFSLSGNVVSFFLAAVPLTGDLLSASYRYADPANPAGSLTAAQVICSSMGSSTSATTSTQLGSCTIPSGLLGAGDRVEVQFQYAHTGTSNGFTGDLRWGGTTILTRSPAAGEASLAGRASFGIYGGGQAWNNQSWGTALALATAAGVTTVDTTQSLTISLNGQMSGTTTDSLSLRSLTVVRYPAQVNP